MPKWQKRLRTLSFFLANQTMKRIPSVVRFVQNTNCERRLNKFINVQPKDNGRNAFYASDQMLLQSKVKLTHWNFVQTLLSKHFCPNTCRDQNVPKKGFVKELNISVHQLGCLTPVIKNKTIWHKKQKNFPVPEKIPVPLMTHQNATHNCLITVLVGKSKLSNPVSNHKGYGEVHSAGSNLPVSRFW